ncbi:MAG: YceD family protein [Bacteroidota bacterium]
MRYQLGPLRRPGGRVSVDLEATAPPGTGAVVEGPVRGRLELSNLETGVAVRGHLTVPLKLACSRCLGVFEQALEIDVNEECALKQIDEPESYIGEDEEPCQIPILNEDDLDLTELVRQMIAIHLPTRPLCHEECPGLCIHCGKDLNEGPCTCQDDEVDPRWAGLKKLKLD